MAGPDLGFLELLNTFLPYVVTAVVGIVALIAFLWYQKKYMPEIARTLTKAYHNRSLPLFIQDEMGNIDLHICDKKFPEGVIHTRKTGWHLLPCPPNVEEKEGAKEKRGPGRPSKEQYRAAEQLALMPENEKEEYVKAYGILVQTPILRGFGKQVFFGSSQSAAVSNLNAIAHANLLAVRKLSPKMYQKTQLDALATGSRIEGLKMAGKETTKLLMYAIIAVVPIACFAIAAWLLTQSNSAGFLLGLL
jgi:hypothetical protein